MNTKPYYERNDYFINSKANITFDEVLSYTDEQFVDWISLMKKEILYAWDVLGCPPRVGFTRDEMLDQFEQLAGFPVNTFLQEDELTGKKNCIRNTSILGNAANQYFNNMMKTKINYNEKNEGRSIYDHFKDDSLTEKVITYARRHFKRDSFYHYSRPIKVMDRDAQLMVNSGVEYIEQFEAKKRVYNQYDYWIESKTKDVDYSGYNEALANQKWLEVTGEELKSLMTKIPAKCISNVNWEANRHLIREYQIGQKLFPIGFKAFRISWCQIPANFPPLTAKFIYERYTDHCDNKNNLIVWDPSAGWGGRILGAMSVNDDRQLHYIGTDPNTDNSFGNTTKYAILANDYNKARNAATLFPHENTFEIFQEGSEVIQFNPQFQKYKGKLDIVFTSPPYFNREQYSADKQQSCNKFGQYESWRDGFLFETLKTAWEWLKSDRYLIWNIADVKIGKTYLPLEKDSIDIATKLGFKHVDTLNMTLAQMPGANRVNWDTENVTAKNYSKVNGLYLKYEPVLVFKKD